MPGRGMQRQTACWLVGLACGGGALSIGMGALGLWARRTPRPGAAARPPAAPGGGEVASPDAAPRGLVPRLLGLRQRNTRAPFRCERGVVYRTEPGPDLALDLYLPLAPGPHPLVVVVHGGGWCGGDRRELPA